MGLIFTQLGMNFAWASPDYLLNEMSLELIFMYYEYMVDELTGEVDMDDTPDIEGFHKKYGDKIKTPQNRKGD